MLNCVKNVDVALCVLPLPEVLVPLSSSTSLCQQDLQISPSIQYRKFSLSIDELDLRPPTAKLLGFPPASTTTQSKCGPAALIALKTRSAICPIIIMSEHASQCQWGVALRLASEYFSAWPADHNYS